MAPGGFPCRIPPAGALVLGSTTTGSQRADCQTELFLLDVFGRDGPAKDLEEVLERQRRSPDEHADGRAKEAGGFREQR